MNKNEQSTLASLGFTLLELLIVLALIGILLAFGLPAYQEHIRSASRAGARSELMNLAQKLEQHYNTAQSYQLDLSPFVSASSSYAFSLRSDSNAEYYVLQAIPAGKQQGDACGILLLDARLIRGAGNVLDNRAELTRSCWER